MQQLYSSYKVCKVKESVIEEFDDGSSLDAVLEENSITITEVVALGDESETVIRWEFIQDGDWLSVDIKKTEEPLFDEYHKDMVFDVLSAALDVQR